MSTNGMAAVIFHAEPVGVRAVKADSGNGQPLAPAGAHDARPVALSCRGIWKIFGPRAAEFLASRSGRVAPADLTAANLIGAVRDASLSVKRGEIFIIM